MIGYKKRRLRLLYGDMEKLREDRSNCNLLFEIQKQLIKEISLSEQRLRETKQKLKYATNLSDTHVAERKIAYLRAQLFCWKSFGDAIAFSYMSRFALKHVFYNINNTNVKQSSGFLHGKDGLEIEISFVEQACRQGLPALLKDVTDTIRYGDVSLMVGPDPYLIEVKKSKKLDRRGRRQRDEIERLSNFFRTDAADNFRGKDRVFRTTAPVEEKDYLSEMSDCISDALANGASVKRPEQGLYYVALSRGADFEKTMSAVDADKAFVFKLNEAKIDREWAPYTPPPLLFRPFDNLYAFLDGQVYVLVICDIRFMEKFFDANNFTATFEPEKEAPLRIASADGQVAQASWHILKRIGYELVSPEWIWRLTMNTLANARSFEEKVTLAASP